MLKECCGHLRVSALQFLVEGQRCRCLSHQLFLFWGLDAQLLQFVLYFFLKALYEFNHDLSLALVLVLNLSKHPIEQR